MKDQDRSTYREYSRELEREVVEEELGEGGDKYDEMLKVREYINRLEAERDYYQQSAKFAGVPSIPRPTVLEDWW